MFDPYNRIGFSMDMVEAHDGDLFIVVDPLSLPVACLHWIPGSGTNVYS